MPRSVRAISTEEDFQKLLKNPGLVVVHFYADWAAECQPMNEVLTLLVNDIELKDAIFANIEAENLPKISMQYNIAAVPTFIFFIGGVVSHRLDGANASKLTQQVKSHYAKAKTLAAAAVPVIAPDVEPVCSSATGPTKTLNDRLKELINQSPIMLFMKGNAEAPQCGFSRQAVALLNQSNVKFGTFDILSSEQVRQGLKTYSNWPTYPQLYVNGELIGGLDIMKELVASAELEGILKGNKGDEPKKDHLEERLKGLINKAPLMVFMKGDSETPRCGFSRQLVEILNEIKLPYETFDILKDEEVRQGLKLFSNWPTYPQVYAKGDLVGGLDIIKELHSSGDLLSALKGE
uniref:Glutaredoxin n=1 Tax=Diaphanosoma celebensis TaxID=2184134 RepID=A0A8H2S6M0_9CRUS|nr:glutaredoxin [Diaphanosoma celebensis]